MKCIDIHGFLVTLQSLGSISGGEAELYTLQYLRGRSQATYSKTSFSTSSPPQCWSQAVVCISIPKMYLRSGYFLLFYKEAVELVPLGKSYGIL